MKKKLFAVISFCIVFIMALTGCGGDNGEKGGNGDSDSGEKMNIMKPYDLSGDEEELAELMVNDTSGLSVVKFVTDSSCSRMTLGYEYYEKGKLKNQSSPEVEAELKYPEDGSNGTLLVNVSGEMLHMACEWNDSETSSTSRTFEKGYSFGGTDECSLLDAPLDIEKDRKIFFYAAGKGAGDIDLKKLADEKVKLGDITGYLFYVQFSE